MGEEGGRQDRGNACVKAEGPGTDWTSWEAHFVWLQCMVSRMPGVKSQETGLGQIMAILLPRAQEFELFL